MIAVHFKVRCQPEKTEEVMAALAEVVAPSREVDGVVSFDIARSLVDPNSFVATEVFEDRAALDRQESLPEVGRVLALLPQAVSGPPEATIYEVSSSEPHGG